MRKQIIAITDRKQCHGDFFQQLLRLADSGVAGIILREKDLNAQEYLQLAQQCQRLLRDRPVPFVLNQQLAVAQALQIDRIQLSYQTFFTYHAQLQKMRNVLVSVHSVKEAVQAAKLGAHGIIAGHIFPTECKKGVKPRGMEFLEQVCAAVDKPVYAIGGIHADTWPLIQESSVAGACVMSQAMAAGKFFWQMY